MNRLQEFKIDVGWTVARLGATAAALVLLNLFPGRTFASALGAHLPWLNLWWHMALALNVIELCLRRRTLYTRLADLLVSAFGTVVVAQTALGGPFADPVTETLVAKCVLAIAFAGAITAAVVKLGLLLEGQPPVILVTDA